MTAPAPLPSLRWIDTGFGSYNGRLAAAPVAEVIAMRGGSSRGWWAWICVGRSGSADAARGAKDAAEAAFRDWCDQAGLVCVVPDAPPEPRVNPIDTPEVRGALMAAMLDVVEAWPNPKDHEERAEHEMTGAILAVLAPHVAALQRAAFGQGVEASAGVSTLPSGTFKPALKAKGLDEDMADLLGETLDTALGLVAETIRAIPTPAEFTAPEPLAEALRLADRLFEMSSSFVQNGCTHGFKPAANCPNEACDERRLHRALLAHAPRGTP